jgi:hypothetical protein
LENGAPKGAFCQGESGDFFQQSFNNLAPVEPFSRRPRLLINHTVLALKGTAMTMFRAIALAAFAALVIASVTGPAGSSATASCGGAIIQIRDPGLRASFAKFEAQQSPAAAKICAAFRNAG